MTTTRTLEIKVNQSGDAEKGLKGITSALGGLGSIAGGVALGGIALIGAGLVESTKAAMEAQDGQAQLQAVLNSTGMAAGVTAEMANNLASAFQNTTRFSDDLILEGENMLLTFTNIGKDVFPQATEAMLNMAEKMGTDPVNASIQLGKALNDPIAGISALTRVGVTFTEEQKNTIKALVETGQTAQAQKIILAELQKEFGGVAEAAGSTIAGKIAILNNKLGDLSEKIGANVLPIIDALLPIISAWIDELEAVGAQALPVINDALTRMSTALGLTTGDVTLGDAAIASFKGILDSVIIAIKLATVVIKLLADGVEQGRRNWESIKGAVNSVRETFNSSMDSIERGVNSVIDKWNDFKRAVGSAIDAIPDWLLPGSPTPFEIGLRGIAKAAGNTANILPQAFNVNGTINHPAFATAGNGNQSIIVHLTYSPMISTADEFELEQALTNVVTKINRKL